MKLTISRLFHIFNKGERDAQDSPAAHALKRMFNERDFDGLKFYRRAHLGACVVDFYCPELALVIQLSDHHPELADACYRQTLFESAGLIVLSFSDELIMNYPEDVKTRIMAFDKRTKH